MASLQMASSTNRRSKSKVSWSPVNLTRDVVQKRVSNNRVINLRLQIISGLLTGDLTDVPETDHYSEFKIILKLNDLKSDAYWNGEEKTTLGAIC